jgi:DNA-binding transcriptional LysR family regulator
MRFTARSGRSQALVARCFRQFFIALLASTAMAFSFRQIQYFVAAAENGAVSRAAHALSISQSTVAEAIRELEADLGFPLFQRKAQGVELTLRGNQFLRHARKILTDVAEARRELRGEEGTAAGRLAIGVTPLVAGYFLAEILARFRRAFPTVTLDIVEDSRGYLEHLLVNGELDVGVIVAGIGLVHGAGRDERRLGVAYRRRRWRWGLDFGACAPTASVTPDAARRRMAAAAPKRVGSACDE